ncbi:MAG: class I SAM-dependent methyltransferase [Lachnospiraceae bacterium]|nr:class I SAM-dependent methyltransferase [Lachnospiraceae bacterium]
MKKSNVAEACLNLSYYRGEDVYSDGDIEDRLLEIAKSHTEEELNKVIADAKDWGTLYHFSHIRRNIVSWMPITKEQTVLEVGSGCGAITGALAQMAKHVTCIDLSKRRSLINAYRNSDYDNIEIMVGNFKDIEGNLPQQYDYITLIGVFEYGEAYIGGDTPYEDFLLTLKKHVKPGGELIIAIENRWGLKYFAGCREDHVGGFFEGINGYPISQGVKTFTRKELEVLFRKTGFSHWDFYYPYPDYKLPFAIYSDEYLPSPGELRRNTGNYDMSRMKTFDEDKVYDDVCRENLFPQFSNSYLVRLCVE